MSDHWDRITKLSPEKRALLMMQLKKRSVSAPPPQMVPQRDDSKPTALSFAQQRLWFLDQLEPGKSVYNLADAVRLTGLLDIKALTQSFNEIVRRHQALRTTFREIDGEPFQIIAPSLIIPMQVEDLSGLTEEDLESEVARLAAEETHVPFDLIRGPLLRIRLLRLGDLDHVLLFTMHHIISDGWSIGVLTKELSLLYEAFSEKKPSPLSDLPIQYADFAKWQRDRLQGELLEKLLSYWTRQLTEAPAVIDLPSDRPRPREQSSRGAKQSLWLSEQLLAALTDLSQSSGATLFMILLAAFKTLLYRYTGVEDIVVGIPISGRNQTETRELIGLFVNTLALRTRLSANLTFRELLEHVRETSLGAYDHADLPFETLTERLRPLRSLSHTPLFQVMFVFQNAPYDSLSLRNISLRPVSLDRGVALYDLTLTAIDADGKLKISLEYNLDLFDHSTSRRMLENLQRLLEGIIANPDQRLSILPMLTEAETQRLLVELNHAPDADPPVLCVHQLFEQQAAHTPDAIAVIFQKEQLSYRELNARANRLARHLLKQGVGPESLVGVLLERSTALPVSLLAILKAGAAYLPLDPAYPPERLSFMLEDANAQVVVTQQKLRERVAGTDTDLICVDIETEEIDGFEEPDLVATVTGANLAYVIYTSGSTGRPKGVAITHNSAVVMLHWARRAFSEDELQCVLFSTSICFDLSVFELFAPLSWGGSVLVVENALALAMLPDDSPPTLINTVPSVMTELLRVRGVPRNVRVVNLAGEALSGQLVEAVYGLPQIKRVWNLYGPTEDTTYSTGAVMSRKGRPTIGQPLDGTRAYVMDQWMGLVPVGVSGELYLGGEGLARGYLGRAELTADRFVPDPFSKKEGARLYRTGDVVRYLPDGQLEFIGRGDQQVKLRGYRIELGEVEAALAGHENVRDAVVVIHKATDEIEQLIAYVVLSEAATETDSLRRHLRTKLPEFMIPAFFVKLNEMPLTPNSKVDRKALPPPDYTQSGSEESHVTPRTLVEELLCQIWAEVLGVERVGVFDSFFELGGHSLMATRLVSRVRKILGIELPLRAIFEEPTVAGLAEQILRAEGVDQRSPGQPLVTIPREGPLKLSFAQQRLWFLHQLEPRSPVYNLPLALRLTGSLNIPALEKTLNEIIRRHESLRTNFDLVDEEPVQVITPETKVTLSITDLRGVEAGNQRARTDQLAIEQWQKPFDLPNELLVRCDLVAIDEQEHVLLVTIHHIVSDGWSMDVFMRELTVLYNAFSEGQPSPLAELTLQYVDYAVWQREWLQGEVLEDQLSYWKQQLAGAPALLELPTDHPRPALRTYRGAAESFKLPEELSRQLKELSRREGATLFMTLLASFQVLLSRYSGQDDVVVGAPIAGRGRMELEGLIGFFVNTLALRVDLSGDPNFTEVLRRVRNACLGAYAHQELPFERLVEELHPERSLSQQPLFQVMFQLRNGFTQEQPLRNLVIQGVNQDRDATKFDLTLSVVDDGTVIQGVMEYSTELFDAETVRRMIGHWEVLLANVIAEPNRTVADVSLLGAFERQMLAEWNDTATGYPTDVFIHELIERQANVTPDSVALVFEDVSLTYCELNERANQLAHYLLSLGIGRDSLVGVLMYRSLEMVVSLLAILKAGAAYLPLDPDYPQQRISFMVQQAQVPLILTQEDLGARLTGINATLLCVDKKWEEIGVHGTSNPPSTVSAEDLAYVIYTSGSTGLPKAAMNTHGGILNFLLWMQETFRVDQSDSVLQKTPFSFDVSVWEFFWPLMVGARLVLARPGEHGDSPYLIKLIEEQQITTLHFVPSQLQVFLEERDLEKCGSLRRVICSGEALSYGLQERCFDRMSAELHDLYGPTEAAIDVTAWACERTSARQVVPIGRPIANTQVYVLDERMQLAPIGVVGELYLGGAGLARGYLGEPALTAAKFVPDLYSKKAGARLYATGDLVRYDRDGVLEYLGRRDQQVKIRGFRIELAEIENALDQHPQVKECAVVMGQGPNQDTSLLAYVVPYPQGTVRTGDLKAFLRQTLPEYMIPSQFLSLEEMPLTSNGKLDRKGLPAPSQSRGDLGSAYVAPRNLIEQAMTDIWSQVLHVERVGVHDDFFALGGHSLLATQLLSRLRHVLKVEVPLRKLFELPTIGKLAQIIERDLQSGQGQEITAIQQVSRKGPLPLSFAQERLWFLDQFEPGSSFYSIPMALRLTGSLDIDALQWALNEVERRHESLRTVFASSQGRPFQRVLEPGGVEIQVAELGEIAEPDPEKRIHEAVVREAQRGFNLALAPLMRVSLIRLSDREHLLLIVMHHIICDAWSMGLLVREMSLLYGSYLAGERPELEELPVQYGDYALWQREWLQGEVLERQLDYWKQKLDGRRAVLELASDRPRPAIQSYRGARVRQEISADVTSDLRRMSREEGATLFMLLLAGFEVLLYKYTAKEDICVGTPIAGRNRFETESVVGLFVNTLVMRVDLSGEPNFSELVGRVRDVVIGAFTNQDVPFEKLVEELNPERSMSHSPLFQVMFALQNTETAVPHLPDLRLELLPCETATSKFDLGLDVYEGQQGLVCSFEYNTDLFDASTIKRLASHYKTLLEAIVADPSRRISDLPLLSESEQQQLVSGWNDTERDYAHQLCVNELFEAQAQSNPDDVAVAFENLTITYGELNRRSNQVAHFLRELGVGPDILVGIYLERSIDVLIAVFGVLKAGGAYVPLDAAYPRERIALLVEDSRLTIVVTQHRISAQLPPFVQHAVCLDRDWQAISGYNHESPPQVALPDNLAYAVYTSGSTGKPKGVMISHRSLVNAFQAWQESYRLDSDCKSHLQMASISFDVFAGDLVRALCSGGTLILCPREFLLEPEKLYELMLRQRVDAAEFVPAVVRQLVGYVAERGLSLDFMKLLVVGSDIWNVWEFEQLKSYCGNTTRVINSYGVSESTVDSSYFESTQIQLSPGGLVPIGRPFGKTSLHVLDSRFRLAPVGVAGELCIGGLGLARGYLNQPDLTAEKFVANPFCKNGGSRLYRTGDCVRRLVDGTIEFLGRLDNQVKIRGFRIELGEIEAALSEHTGVREAVVMASEAGPGNPILVAYIVPEPGQSTGAAELRRFLKESLPEHMIPSAFVEMERMPLSANGKLDRRALPAPRAVRPDLEQSFVAPRNNIEETINDIWVEVLKIDRIGVNDSFFDLGGHSLLATQVASRLRKAFKIEIPLRSLFENPTIAELGQTVDALIRNGQHGELKSITPVPKDKPLQLSFAQERLWFLNRLQPGTPFYNSPTAVRLFGTLDIQALARSLAEVARRHEVLRTTFPTVDGRPTLLISPPQPMSLPVIDINGVPALERETRARELINEEVMRHFDLERGLLWRGVLLRLAEQDHVLVFNTHHIVSDAWSMDVLVREAVTLYEAFSNNRPSPLADLAIQYTDFTAWQREWMRGEVLDAHLDYWKKQLSGAPVRLRLPTDRPRSSSQNHRGKRLTLPLSRSLIGPLKEVTRQSGTTLFMGLLAAFQTLLYRYTGQDDIVVGTAIAGRGRAEIEGLIGFFINMLVMRTSLAGAPKFLDLLSRVKETALGAYAHQDLPFEKLVEALQPQRDSGGSPLFQVAFGLQNTPAPYVQLPGLEVRSVGFDEHTVRYDLTLWIWDLTDGMTAAWTYSTDLFDESTIIRMHQHYDALLLNIVANPEERVNALEMLTEAEKKQRAVDERQSHDLKLESLRTSRRAAIEISAEPV